MSTGNVEDLSRKDAGKDELESVSSDIAFIEDGKRNHPVPNSNIINHAGLGLDKSAAIGFDTGFDTENGNIMQTEVDEEAALSGMVIGQDGDEFEYNDTPNTKEIEDISLDAKAASRTDAVKAAHGTLGLESLKITRNGQELGITEAAYIIANAILQNGDVAHNESNAGPVKSDTITSFNHAPKPPIRREETNTANDAVTALAYHKSKGDPSGSSFNRENLFGDIDQEPLGSAFGNRFANASGYPDEDPGDASGNRFANASGYPGEDPGEDIFGESKWNQNSVQNSIQGLIGNNSIQGLMGVPHRFLNPKQRKAVARVKETRFFPEDCYSFIALNGPASNGMSWSREKMLLFGFGILPFIFQMMFLLLLISSVITEKRGTLGENDNPWGELDGWRGFFGDFIPSNAPPVLRCTQVLSIMSYLIFRNSTVKDFVKSVQLWPNSSLVIHGDPIGSIKISCFLRGLQGGLAMLATFLLVATSKEVVDVVLNFTAIGFVSELDDVAFDLAKTGDFGPIFRKESERIVNEKLPLCMVKDKDARYYINKIIVSTMFGMIFLALVVMTLFQKNQIFVTKALRVQFQEPDLVKFGGCFDIDPRSSTSFYNRPSYKSYGGGESTTSFIYCRDERQWIMFKGDINTNRGWDPCFVRGTDVELARSTKTDTFDISTAFEERWVSSSNAPLRLYFFESALGNTKESLYCDLTLGDGKCDDPFNAFSYQWDIGDCCPATCKGSKCGRGLYGIFGIPNISGISFPVCKDPVMESITIRLNDISSSRNPEFTPPLNEFFERFNIDETDWRAKTPVSPYFALNCNGKTVLSFYIEEEMKYNSETLEIEDGASCYLEVRNNTRTRAPDPDDPADPIWFVNYTLFHGNGEGDKQIEILSHHSSESATVNFTRIPECFFSTLGNYIDDVSIYTSFDPPNQAIDWIVQNDPEKSECADDFFKERYALISMFFAMNRTSELISREKQCSWPSVICKDGRVISLTLEDKGLNGGIPSEIHLLPNLTKLELARNTFTLIPTEINQMASLEELVLTRNEIVSISTEIGRIVNLTRLDLGQNRIESVPADLIGLMTSMDSLVLSGNKIASLPTEIGLMTSLQDLVLDLNKISSIPREIGNLTNVKLLSFDVNSISFLPTEIALMTNLKEISVFINSVNFIPTEFGKLTKMQKLDFYFNNMTSLPTEMGLLNSLRILDLTYNKIKFLPTEIGLLTSMQRIVLNKNEILSLPSEIGSMITLQELRLSLNQIKNLPSEIGLMMSLKNMTLYKNKISSIATEIGLMKNLLELDLRSNQITSLPSEIGLMTSLSRFLLDNNQIKSLPTDIGAMSSMVELKLFDNSVSSLPTEIGLMTSLQELELSINYIKSIPTQIGGMKSLEILRFDYNEISSVPTEIGLLTSLQTKLSFYGNQISSLPTEIGLMTSVRELSFAVNPVTSIPTEIGKMSKLQKLYSFSNQISSVPSTLGLLTNLQELYLHNNTIASFSGIIPEENGFSSSLHTLWLHSNYITAIPTEIGLLTNLQYLQLDKNFITSVPTEIGQASNLRKLDLSSNQILSVPSTLGLLSNLQELYLYDNSIASFSGILPKDFGFLSSLHTFWLHSNYITAIPTEIGLLTNLQYLQFDKNFITFVPEEIGQASNLRKLDLSSNQILSVPNRLGELTNLQELYLFDNQLSSVPDTIGLLTNLQALHLHDNQISTVPSTIGLLTNLQELYLHMNKITSIPSEIGLLSSLQLLVLFGNQISSVPSTIGQLSNLQRLYLDNNQITALPTEIGLMTSLNIFSLYGNSIASIPSEIGNLKSLLKLDLSGTNITDDDIPKELYELCTYIWCIVDFDL